MPAVRLAAGHPPAAVLALPVRPGNGGPAVVAGPAPASEEYAGLLEQVCHTGRPGQIHDLPRPHRRPHRVLLAGVGDGGEAGWRSAGASIARSAARETSVTVAVPDGSDPAAVSGLVEGVLLGAYRFRLGSDPPDRAPRLRRVTVAVDQPEQFQRALARAQQVASATRWARDLTNTPSLRKNPAWFVRQVELAVRPVPGLQVRVWDEKQLREAGFGGIAAVGAGSASPPRLVQV